MRAANTSRRWANVALATILLLLPGTFVWTFSVAPTKPPTKTNPQQRQAGWSIYWKRQETPEDVKIVTSMPPPLPMNLKNRYYLLRHGQSTGNVEGVISSSRSLATSNKHGLTRLGYNQGKNSSLQLLDVLDETSKAGETVLLYSSPFARARQTAQACLDGLTESASRIEEMGLTINATIEIEDRLMERYFGRLDDAAIHTYAYVWPVDKFNVTHSAFDVESVAAVATRLHNLVMDLEQRHEKQHIVLVSHADVLQICQLYAAGTPNVGAFSSYRFGNGEVRAMKRTPDSLPEPQPLQPPPRGT